MPNVPSAAVGFIAIESEKAPVEVALSDSPADATLKETLARLAGGAPSPARLTGRHFSRHDRLSRLDSPRSAMLCAGLLTPHTVAFGEVRRTPPSATVYVEVDLHSLVVQLKAEAEALGKRIDAALDVTRRAAAMDMRPKPKAR